MTARSGGFAITGAALRQISKPTYDVRHAERAAIHQRCGRVAKDSPIVIIESGGASETFEELA